MARIDRHELKHDEFVDSIDQLRLWAEEHQGRILTVAAVVVVGAALAGGGWWYARKQRSQAGAALSAALVTFQAPVQAGLPPLPGAGPQQTFASEQEKYQAAEKQFAEVTENYRWTQAALMARHYRAVCWHHLGKTAEAITELEDLAGSSNRNVAGLAKLTLAGLYETQNRSLDAENLYRELADRPTATVPREMALLELAELKASGDPMEARRLYQQLQSEHPDSALAAEIARRLELLPPAPQDAAPAPPSVGEGETPSESPAATTSEP